MAEIGRADLVIVPRFDGLSASINRALGGADMSASGSKMGTSLGVSMAGATAKSIVTGTLIAGAIEKVVGFVTDKMGDAVSRLDTMENYKLVMQNLGYGADTAEASIKKMSDRLQNLPTTLDSMAGTVQGLSVITGDLDKATDAGLALNDMLLASGSNTELVSAAGEQFRQMLAKGKPEMQDWKSLMQAAPAQMQALAKEMLGTEATTNDLYEALGGGGHAASISMDELLDAMIRLDTEGGGGLASFRQQAETAQGGIETAMANMGNAVTKGLANVMDEVGRDKIAGAFNLVRDGINGAFSGLQNGVVMAKDAVTLLMESADPADNRIGQAVQNIVSDLGEVPGAAALASGEISALTRESSDAYREAIRATTDYTARKQEHAAASEQIAERYQNEASKLAYAQGVIEKYANSTSLSSAEQANFARAIETVNDLCGTNYQVVDAASGAYADEAGNVQQDNEQLKHNIELRRMAARAQALDSEYQETEKDYAKAADEMGKWQSAIDKGSKSLGELMKQYNTFDLQKLSEKMTAAGDDSGIQAMQQYMDAVMTKMPQARKEYDAAAQSMAEMAAASAATDKAASGAELSLGEMASASTLVQTAFMEGGSKAELSMVDFSTAIETCAENTELLHQKMSDPQAMEQLVQSYDGTAESIKGVIESWGVAWDDNAAKAMDSKKSVDEVSAALSNMGGVLPVVTDQLMHMDVSTFTQQLADANISAETLSTMGLPGLTSAMQESGGKMDALIAIINAWNQAPMYDKNGKVDVSGISTLRDAQGRVYTWNGTDLRDQDGKVVVDTVDLEDAQGKKMEWNGSDLQDKSGTGTIDGNMQDGINQRDNWNSTGLVDHFGSGVISITRSITEVFNGITGTGSAIGGFRPHADGGIARKAVPLDVVGEDGAEAIVPLTNKKYAMPFVNLIADEIGERGGGGNTYIFNVNGAESPELWARRAMRETRRLATAEGR